jgi:hypothetical protein
MTLSLRDNSFECRWQLFREEFDMGPTVALCTIFAVFLTVLLEFATHARFGSTPTKPPKAYSESQRGDEDVELLPVPSTPAPPCPPAEQNVPDEAFWPPNEIPDPRTRATRFALGLVIYAGVVTLFSIRIWAAVKESIGPSACKGEKGIGPDWTAIAFLNIIPFVCASVAFVRCLVDCVLVRYGTFLGNGRSERGMMVWKPFVLIVGAYVVVAGLLRLLLECVKLLPALVMGRSEVSMFTRGFGEGSRGMEREIDEEMCGEEERGLIEHVDGGEEAEPPAYEEAVGTKN